MVSEVISKGYYKCSQEEIRQAYIEVFGFALCGHCENIDFKLAFHNMEKKYNKINGVLAEPNKGKYIFNPVYAGTVAYYKGEVITDKTTDQELLFIIFNQPMRKGLVIENPNYEP